jgi:hypothetical protein
MPCMSLGIAFKGPEGIVLAADSRVTIEAARIIQGRTIFIPATFDNATKLLKAKGQDHIGAVTYGMGALGKVGVAPRTAHSFIPEFEEKLAADNAGGRLSVEEFAKQLAAFFLDQWNAVMPNPLPPETPDMVFLVGGYDQDAPYGRVFELSIPRNPDPKEWFSGNAEFGAVWGGQKEFVERLLNGYDSRVIQIAEQELNLQPADTKKLADKLSGELGVPIPYPFLPLQDCVDLSIFLVRATIRLQTWTVGIRGVGGAIDVATITKADGFVPLQQKQLVGERLVQ